MISIHEAIAQRHSVRAYHERALEPDVRASLQQLIDECNAAGGLHIQLVCNESQAFDCFWAHYGKFSGVTSYLAMAGPVAAPDLDERLGYYGEKIVLRAQQMGLNTCWVGLSYKKVAGAYTIGPGEKLRLLIAIGYGKDPAGRAHKRKRPDQVMRLPQGMDTPPDWFLKGIDAALLAPTAVNQQQFRFTLHPDGHTVSAKAGMGFYSHVDLGIVRLHFEIGAGTDRFSWETTT